MKTINAQMEIVDSPVKIIQFQVHGHYEPASIFGLGDNGVVYIYRQDRGLWEPLTKGQRA